MYNQRLYTLTIVLLIICISCKKSTFERDQFIKATKLYDLSVEGGINTHSTSQYIKLTKPALHPDSSPSPIRGARVNVHDGRMQIDFRETAPGIYMGRTQSEPNYNMAYTLTINYGSKTYTAVDTLRPVVNIVDDFLPLSVRHINDQSVEVMIPKHTFGYLNPNKWYIGDKDVPAWNAGLFNQAQYYSYTHPYGSPNSLYPLNTLKRSFIISKNDYIYIYKISLSEGYASYLYKIFMETDWSGLFSSVPVNVEGNVSDNAQGYFYACDIQWSRYRGREL